MQLPDIDPERMQAASEALDKVIKAGGTAAEARAEFERVLKGEVAAEPPAPPAAESAPEKPARKPRADKGQPRKKAPPKPEELAVDAKATRIGQLFLELVKEAMS